MKGNRNVGAAPGWLIAALCSCAVGSAALASESLIRRDGVPNWWETSREAAVDLRVASTDATSVRLQWTPLAAAVEYVVWRDGANVGSTVAAVGYFTDFGLRPAEEHEYVVDGYDGTGTLIARSSPVSATTTKATAIRTHYTVLALAFNPKQESLVTESVYLRHRIQFLALASNRDAIIDVYSGSIVSAPVTPPLIPGSTDVDYASLVTSPDIPGLDGFSIVDLVERGDIDHVWVVKSPAGAGFAENVLIGNRPIQGDGVTGPHSWIPLPVKSSRSFFVNSYGPDERSWDAYAHMVEGIMTSISDGHPKVWPRVFRYKVYVDHWVRTNMALVHRRLNVWERFRLADGWNGKSPVAFAAPGRSNVGSSHFLPTTPRTGGYDDYTYFDYSGPAWHRYVDSEADYWLQYPGLAVTKRKINGYEFGAFNHYKEGDSSYAEAFGVTPDAHASYKAASSSFHQWWFAHLPGNAGVTNGTLNSWWPYLFDFNRFDGSPIDYRVNGFRRISSGRRHAGGEIGTDDSNAINWGYWHSQNGFSPGGKAGTLNAVNRKDRPELVKEGRYSLEVEIESSQYWEWLGVGRNDVFYPVSRNAHWHRPYLQQVRFSIKPKHNASLLVGTNPIIRLYKNPGTRIELVPVNLGVYANRLEDLSIKDVNGWYNISAPLAGSEKWEKNVIGYIDPSLPVWEHAIAKARLEQEILADLNYIEISVRSTAVDSGEKPFHRLSYFIDELRLEDY